jgi:hypothetical protein
VPAATVATKSSPFPVVNQTELQADPISHQGGSAFCAGFHAFLRCPIATYAFGFGGREMRVPVLVHDGPAFKSWKARRFQKYQGWNRQ